MTWDRRLYFPSEGRRAEDFFALKNPKHSSFILGVKWCAHFSLHVEGPIRAAMEFARLVPRCDKCVSLLTDYVESQWHLVEYIIYANFVITLICMSYYGTLSIEHVNQLTALPPHTQTPPSATIFHSTHKSLHAGLCTFDCFSHLAPLQHLQQREFIPKVKQKLPSNEGCFLGPQARQYGSLPVLQRYIQPPSAIFSHS